MMPQPLRSQRGCLTPCDPAHRLVASIALLVSLAAAGCSTLARQTEPLLTPEQKRLNVESFDYVWNTIQEKHWQETMEGVDWRAMREEYRPQVEAAQTMTEARTPMNEMIKRIGKSHYGIIPAEVYDFLDVDPMSAADGEQTIGQTGVSVRVLDGLAVVTDVYGEPALSAGVRSGWVITRIRDEDVGPVIETVSASDVEPRYRQLYLAGAIRGRLTGPAGKEGTVTFLDEIDEERVIDLVLARPSGTPARLGNIPTMHVRFEQRRLDENVGYIFLNMFFDPVNVMKQFEEAVKSFNDTDGIVIDLRGNPGGIGAMAMGMAGWFIDEPGLYIGTMYMRNTELKLIINPRLYTYTKPLAILVDGLSTSSSEFFAGGLQALGRARVFGTRTPGAALPSTVERLPNNDGFQYAFANYISADGEALEGKGVIPDVEVHLSRDALLAGRDPVIEAAVEWIESQ